MKVSKHMSDLIPTLSGIKGKYWGYFPSKVQTATTQGTDWHEVVADALEGLGYVFERETEPAELFDHMVTKRYFTLEDEEGGRTVVELTQYADNGYTWVHVCVSGDALHAMDVWKALYGDDVYETEDDVINNVRYI